MESSAKGIDVGGRVLNMLLAFVGENEEQNRVFFKVKGKKVLAAATAKNRAIEVEGKAGDGAEDGEWPVEAGFLRNLANMTVNGSPKVPAVVARLVLQRTGVSTADLVEKQSGKVQDTVQHHAEMPANKQLTFGAIHKTIRLDFDEKASWFPVEKKALGALNAVFAAVGKSCPVSFVGGTDEQSPVGFQAKGEDFTVRGILMPPAVNGPGREATNPDTDDDEDGDEDDDDADERQLDLLERKEAAKAAVARVMAEDDEEAVIDDQEAERIKAEQGGKAPEKKPRKVQKRKKAGS